MAWQWWLLVHLTGVLVFVGAHGVSMFVMFRIRGERDRQRIAELITFSGTTTRPMYIGLAILTVGGVGAGLTLHLFSQWWLWIAIAILLITIGLMSGLAEAVLPPDHGLLRDPSERCAARLRRRARAAVAFG